jgi:sugar/nucleoside kinase (ribokinase family)
MLSDRPVLAVEGLAAALVGADWVHVSGYALRDSSGPAIARALAALPDEVRVSVGGGSLPPGDESVRFAELMHVAQPDLLVVSRDEAAALGSGFPAVTVTTAGAHGSSATVPGMQPLEVPAAAPAGLVLDTTGAGDAYAAALIDELARLDVWPPPVVGLERAMAAASRLGADVARVDGAQGRVTGSAQR